MSEEIQLEDFKISIAALWRNKIFICCVTVLATLIGLLMTFNEEVVNTYVSKTTVYSVAYGSVTETNRLTDLLISYAEIITSNKVCERAASLLEGNTSVDAVDIKKMIGVNSINNSVIEIYAISTDPWTTISVTNAVAEAFVREVTSITKNDAIQILDSAVSCSLNSNGTKDIIIKRGIFTVIGFALGCVYIVCRELSSKKIKSVIQCIDKSDNEILGIVPFIDMDKEWDYD